MSTMIINFNPATHTLWHSNCDAKHAPPMKEIAHYEKKTLMECTKCGERGFYPVGKTGLFESKD